MYKVGDEVLIKGKVIEVMDAVPYPAKVKLGKDEDAYFFSNDEICFADKIVKTYSDGLKYAWELAKKIGQMDCIYLDVIFGSDEESVWNHTYEEALAKIEAYEKEKGIKVGDEVYGDDEPDSFGVVTLKDSFGIYVMWKDGSSGRDTKPESLHRTGKHIDIESLLRQIGE